jgi:hypothetical protein
MHMCLSEVVSGSLLLLLPEEVFIAFMSHYQNAVLFLF